VAQPGEDFEALINDIAGFVALDMGDEADPARVVLGLGLVQAVSAWACRRVGKVGLAVRHGPT
jgi:hypothetical protein